MNDRVRMDPEWAEALAPVLASAGMARLREFLIEERAKGPVYPPNRQLFTALDLTPPSSVKCVILGMDPYIREGQAHGLSFSVPPGVPIPPSLANIHKEMSDDLGIAPPRHGNLEAWARRGVLLLNAVLSVREGQTDSHKGKGWEAFTDAVIAKVAEGPPTAFVLWGAKARKKTRLIDQRRHLVVTSAHPSPLSATAGFFGSRPFSKVNRFLEEQGRGAIDWTLPEAAGA